VDSVGGRSWPPASPDARLSRMIDPALLRERGAFRDGRVLALLFVLPGILLVAGIIWPFIQGVHWAFSDFTLTRPDKIRFNSGVNIIAVFTPGTVECRALLVTLRFAVACVAIETLLGFTIALLLNWPARWTKVFRVIVVMPMLAPPIAATIMWRVMLVDRGVINYLLAEIGLAPVNWFGSPTMAFWAVVLIDAWIFTPFAIVILLAGLQSIPREIVEAATVDGAGPWAKLRHIYLPMTAPFLTLVVLFRGIDNLKMFDVIWSSTKGGPVGATKNLHVFGYEQGISYLNFGRSMATLFVLWALCQGLSMILLGLRRKEATA
jgi:multiple sugar transport system permease protein